jgi:hypothetical protein
MSGRWVGVRTGLGWCAATAAGIAVCWLGVRPVLAAAVPDRLVAFPANSPPRAATAVVPSQPVTSKPASPSASATPTGSKSPTKGPSAGPPSSAPPKQVPGWTSLGNGAYSRSFQLQGGTVSVRAANGTMELLSASPKTGFVMTVKPTGDGEVDVTFSTLLHVSALDAFWQGGVPTAKVDERVL